MGGGSPPESGSTDTLIGRPTLLSSLLLATKPTFDTVSSQRLERRARLPWQNRDWFSAITVDNQSILQCTRSLNPRYWMRSLPRLMAGCEKSATTSYRFEAAMEASSAGDIG